MGGKSQFGWNLDKALEKLEATLNLIENDRNPIIKIALLDLKNDIEEVNNAILEFSKQRRIFFLDDLLEERILFKKCDELLGKISGLIFLEFTYLTQIKYDEVVNPRKKMINEFFGKMLKTFAEIGGAYSKANRSMSDNRCSDAEFIQAIKYEYRRYCRDSYNDYFQELRIETKEFKPYPGAPLTEEVWGNALGCLFNAMDLAVKDKLNEIVEDDKRYAHYDKEQMTREYALMDRCSRVMQDDELFDFDYANDSNVNLYSELRSDNLMLFFWLVLRHDMIICEMRKDLKERFMAWKDGNEYIPTTDNTNTHNNMAEKTVTVNYYAPIYNNGTMDGDIIAPTYNCNGEAPETFDVADMFNGNIGGIGERSQFWLLLVAAMARGKQFDNIPAFVREAFTKWSIPLDEADCQKSVQDQLKGQPYTSVHDQQSMRKFISDMRKQPTQKANDLGIANRLYVALKDVDWG